MAKIERASTQIVVWTTVGELADAWPNPPEEWGMLGPQNWDREERVYFTRCEDGGWQMNRVDGDGIGYCALDERFEVGDLPVDADEIETP